MTRNGSIISTWKKGENSMELLDSDPNISDDDVNKLL